MARAVTVKVEGLRQVEQALGEMEKAATARAVTRRALTAGGEVIAREARQLAPVGAGDLRESIGVSGTLSRSAKRRHHKESDQEVFVGPGSHPQAITQEFGTSFHAPSPYMTPAWDAKQGEALQRVSDTLWLEIDKVAKSEARRAARVAAQGNT